MTMTLRTGMLRAGCAVWLLGAGAAVAAPPAAQIPHYTLQASIPLGGPDKWDYVAFDPVDQRVYVAHGTGVTVIDARQDKVIGTLGGIDGAHGTVPMPQLGKIFADSGKTGTVIVYDDKSLAPLATIPAVGDADGMTYDAASGRVVVLGGDSASAGFIDPMTDRLTATLPLGGSPEGAAVDGAGKMYVNISDRNEIAVVDTRTPRVLADWKLTGCNDPHGLTMDPSHKKLFVSCPAGHMAVVSIASGRQIGLVRIGRGTDTAGFDPVRDIALSSDGDGTLGIVADRGVALGDVPTEKGARTMAVDPATGRVFMVTATVEHATWPAASGAPHFVFVPGSVRLLVYKP
ncbi:MAG TPA: YncE family protein [Acidocella sp.]|uniref:YncE family protein n=1 Tax=Acidocella sp. TaxID=50710 RepID=UPI002B6D721B|nr:YncE family protein [Acidocella sp.]HVE20955.1 YncE family protein [Acidocella sp.]